MYIYIHRHHKTHDISIHSFGGNYPFTESKTHMLYLGDQFFSEQDDFVLKKVANYIVLFWKKLIAERKHVIFGFIMRYKWIVSPVTFHPYTISTAERSPPLIVHLYMYIAGLHTTLHGTMLVSDTEGPVTTQQTQDIDPMLF